MASTRPAEYIGDPDGRQGRGRVGPGGLLRCASCASRPEVSRRGRTGGRQPPAATAHELRRSPGDRRAPVDAMAWTRAGSRTPYWWATRFRKPAAAARRSREVTRDLPSLGEGEEDLAVAAGHVQPGVGQPVGGERDGFLQRDEQVEDDDLAGRPIGLERARLRRQDAADAIDRVADSPRPSRRRWRGQPRWLAPSTARVNVSSTGRKSRYSRMARAFRSTRATRSLSKMTRPSRNTR